MIRRALFSDLRGEITAEINYRERCFPDLIARGRIEAKRAQERIQILRDVVALLDHIGPRDVNLMLHEIRAG